jgi:hypothetical protein
VYLTNVESICRRFCDDKRGKLAWLKEEEEGFASWWRSLGRQQQRELVSDRGDTILKVGGGTRQEVMAVASGSSRGRRMAAGVATAADAQAAAAAAAACVEARFSTRQPHQPQVFGIYVVKPSSSILPPSLHQRCSKAAVVEQPPDGEWFDVLCVLTECVCVLLTYRGHF